MQINDFTGGVDIRNAPNLIKTNEAVNLVNVDLSSQWLKPLKLPKDLNTTVKTYFYKWQGKIIDSDTYRTFLEYHNKLLWADPDGNGPMKYDGTNTYTLGIPKPVNKVSLSENGSGNLNGDYNYSYTYYNSNDGTESQPNNISDTISVSNKQVKVTNIVHSNNTQVDKIRLYRRGGNVSKLQLVIELNNVDQEYIDNTADTNLGGVICQSMNYKEAPKTLKQIQYTQGMFIAFEGNKVRWSEIGNPNYWSEFNFVQYEEDVTGIVLIQGGLLVFLKNKTYIIQGTSPHNFVNYLLDASQGCIDYKSIQYIKGQPVWMSYDGVCSYDGAVKVISKDKLGKFHFDNIKCSAVYDEVYYLISKNKQLVFDIRYGPKYSYLDMNIDYLSYSIYDDTLYCSYQNKLYEMFKGNDANYVYQSAELSDELINPGVYYKSYKLTEAKLYKDIFIRYEGGITIDMYIDNKQVFSRALLGNGVETLVPQGKQRGYSSHFVITGTGIVKELDFIAQGRQYAK